MLIIHFTEVGVISYKLNIQQQLLTSSKGMNFGSDGSNASTSGSAGLSGNLESEQISKC